MDLIMLRVQQMILIIHPEIKLLSDLLRCIIFIVQIRHAVRFKRELRKINIRHARRDCILHLTPEGFVPLVSRAAGQSDFQIVTPLLFRYALF